MTPAPSRRRRVRLYLTTADSGCIVTAGIEGPEDTGPRNEAPTLLGEAADSANAAEAERAPSLPETPGPSHTQPEQEPIDDRR